MTDDNHLLPPPAHSQANPPHNAPKPDELKHEAQKLHEAPRVKSSLIHLVIIIAMILFAVVAVIGIVTRVDESHKLRKDTDKNAVQTVSTIIAQSSNQPEEISLPGTVQAWHEATVYARTSGYLKSWNTDIGSHVKAGAVLAEIDAPDLDAQFHQAQANLGTAVANNDIAQLTAKRYVLLRKTDAVSQQQADQAVATAAADAAAVDAAKANLDLLQQQENFKSVVAPFDGTITRRNVDVGALINSGNSASTNGSDSAVNGQDMFHIADTSKLRVYVQVPELNAASINPDLDSELHFPQHPEQVFSAKLARTADALDPTNRTLLIELEVDNKDGVLMPGGYADAHFKLPQVGENIILPVNALLFRDIERVGVVKDGKVALQPVKIGRDFGKTVEITTGIAAGDVIVVNPPDSLQDGQQVNAVSQDKDKKSGGQKQDQKPAAQSGTTPNGDQKSESQSDVAPKQETTQSPDKPGDQSK